MSDLVGRLWVLAIIVTLIGVFLIALLVITGHTSAGSKGKKFTSIKRKAMHPSPPKELLSKKPEGLTIGKYKRWYVNLPFPESPLHMMLMGEPGAGKTSTVENSILYHSITDDASKTFRSVLCVDSKPEIARKGVDESRRDIRIVNPTSMYGCGFDVMYGITKHSTDDELKVRCRQISRSLIPDQHGDNEYFSSSAQNILTGMLMYGFRKGLSFIDSVNKVKAVKTSDLIAEIMADADMESHPKIRALVSMYEGNDSDEFSSITDTLGKDLDIFQNDSVIHCFGDENTYRATPQDLIDGISIYLTIPDTLTDDYSRILGMVIEICLRYAMSQDEYSVQGKRPIYFLCDEATSIFIPSLPVALMRGRSKGCMVAVIGQSEKGLRVLYGRDQADVMKECCQVKVYFSCSDPEIAKGLSESCGQFEEKRTSYTHQGMSAVSSSNNTSTQYRNCLDISDITSLPDRNEVLVFYKSRWFIVNRCPYFKIPAYNEKSKELFTKNRAFEGR